MKTDGQAAAYMSRRPLRGGWVAALVAGMLGPGMAGERDPGTAAPLDLRTSMATTHAAVLSPPVAALDGQFGRLVALSGDTAVAYEPGRQETHVFERNAGGPDAWGLARTIPGRIHSLDLDRDTLVRGQTAFRYGWVYIHERNAGGAGHWGQVAVLVGPQPRERDFAWFVSIGGDAIAVSQFGTTSVRVFERHAGGPHAWGEVWGAGSTGHPTAFGVMTAMDSGTLVIPDPYESGGGAVYVHERGPGGWTQAARLTAPSGEIGFGNTVAVHGDTIVATAFDSPAAPVVVCVFERDSGGPGAWGFVARLTPEHPLPEGLGYVSVHGDRIVAATVGTAERQGGAYVFDRNRGGVEAWGQVARLTAPATAPGDAFGWWTTIDGQRLLVSAHREDVGALDSGAAHLFEIEGRTWVEVAEGAAGEGADGDAIGAAASMSGAALAVGAPLDDVSGEDSGAVHVLRRNTGGADGWGRVATLRASDGSAGDRFGAAVAVDRSTAVVGSRSESAGRAGAVYVYERTAGGVDAWGETAVLVADDGGAGDGFGRSVAIHHHLVVAGAPKDGEPGSAYVFERHAGGSGAWGQVARLTADHGEAGDGFGNAVATDGSTIVVGAEFRDASAGAAYVFAHDPATDAWIQVRKLTASDGGAGDRFGGAVAIGRSTLVVGAAHDGDGVPLRGSAYVFERDLGGANNWSEARKLVAGDAIGSVLFGSSVAVDRGRVVVGAPLDGARADDFGAAYVFARNEGGADNWGQVAKLVPAAATPDTAFGRSVALEGATVAGGGPGHLGHGSAWIFRHAGALCGDAVLDDDEACDDGGLIDGDGCSSACELEPCDDADGDGFGLLGRPACPGGSAFDCRPLDGTVYPGAPESCDGRATDCDGAAWPRVPSDEVDDDGDGLAECEGDCNDANDDTYPGAPQICDTENNDCNDPEWPTPAPDNVDMDGDGFALCNGECDDEDPNTYPRAPFVCDGINTNCWDYFYPDPAPSESDADGDGWFRCAGDCDDADPTRHPEAIEICNGIDDDCNDLIDDDALGGDTDLDTLANACDNCPAAANLGQTDDDADGVGNACDLDDGIIWLVAPSSGTVAWQEEAGYVTWNLYRGDLAVLRAGGDYTQPPGSNALAARFCGLATPGVDDPLVPATGTAAFYLVTGVAGSESDLGTDGSGMPRPNATPCP